MTADFSSKRYDAMVYRRCGHPGMSSVLIGASRRAQVDEAVQALRRPGFNEAELEAIDTALQQP